MNSPTLWSIWSNRQTVLKANRVEFFSKNNNANGIYLAHMDQGRRIYTKSTTNTKYQCLISDIAP